MTKTEIDEILKMNPKSECIITYEGYEEWKNCYYQIKNDSNINLDPNKLPELDEKYMNDSGDPLLNDEFDEVFDPSQEINYENDYTLQYKRVYKSKTFIGLFHTLIKKLIEHEIYNPEEDDSIEFEVIDLYHGKGFIDDLCYKMGCDDVTCIEEKEDDELLWFTSSYKGFEHGDMTIEEIKL